MKIFLLVLSTLLAGPVTARIGRERKALAPPLVDDQFIVILKDTVTDVDSTAKEIVGSLPGVSILFTYNSVFKGFAVSGLVPALLDSVLGNNLVDAIEEDSAVSIDEVQAGATWGLDRIDDQDLPMDGTYTYTCTGKGSYVYVLDTGIRISHNEFGGRAICGASFISSEPDCDDGNGHGTHCAGTVAGTTYGVAKNAIVVAVKVLSAQGSGTASGVIAGVDFVASQKEDFPDRNVIASMSLGGGKSSSLDRAVNNASEKGVVFVVAAGNDNIDACNQSPAGASQVITVGSTTSQDARSSFSNYGSCVDIFAPGSSITSAYYRSDSDTARLSGTSMSCPHVAGVAALYLEAGKTITNLLEDGIRGTITDVGPQSPNLFLNTQAIKCDDELSLSPPPTTSPIAVPPEDCASPGSACSGNAECCSGSCTSFLFLFNPTCD